MWGNPLVAYALIAAHAGALGAQGSAEAGAMIVLFGLSATTIGACGLFCAYLADNERAGQIFFTFMAAGGSMCIGLFTGSKLL